MIDKNIAYYEYDLTFGNEIIYKELKILNCTVKDLRYVMYSEPFYIAKNIYQNVKKNIFEDIEMNLYVLSVFVECHSVNMSPFGEYSVAKLVNDENENSKFKIITLNNEEVNTLFKLIKEMYWISEPSKNDKLIDESKAADEKTLQGIRKCNENQLKYNNNSKGKGKSMIEIINRCASIGLGGYNFETIQDLTLYQIKSLIDAHSADCIFKGFYGGLYSQADLKKVDMSDINWC